MLYNKFMINFSVNPWTNNHDNWFALLFQSNVKILKIYYLSFARVTCQLPISASLNYRHTVIQNSHIQNRTGSSMVVPSDLIHTDILEAGRKVSEVLNITKKPSVIFETGGGISCKYENVRQKAV